ncbi:hypothetical protein TREMEDRAFT_31933 [Tremella mesenterica DSM 1558]|uniref:uncharacterized protein n=1 Tax=Tremella mesenterica (strain ATCC 24925 / CBS 8224 / DSM 1558 / NBRC 9311 / NRRL Y-6157 / RJB 2259-6 / UBC 559-6) TaxID=578456 RepID=UPI0003F4906F|nr:uncharacterized protein TREMEDRAFT_31933 [Tremella mesenterica DSM 1558]EIW68769.1 hypothetical protein TREMEDRAFT_31933 [Tremella mesenterica DSM 1558]
MSSKSVHLVVLIHGLWGNPLHLSAAKAELEDAWSHRHISEEMSGRIPEMKGNDVDGQEGENEMIILIPEGMTSQLTYDGIDVCASRVLYEVDREVDRIEKSGKIIRQFSVTGYSLGGLVARYLVGLLHSRSPSFFEGKETVSFSTIATPHLGVPRYNTFLSTSLVWLGARLLSRSGEQLYVSDKYSPEDPRPLLEIMADPNLVFIQALKKFKTIQIFANGINDHTVPYPSAAIELTDPFTSWETLDVTVDENGLLRSWEYGSDTKGLKREGGWRRRLGSLPPVFKFGFPYNYLILVLFPVMFPLVFILLVIRLSLDTRKSRRRLQLLANPLTTGSVKETDSGLSIEHLRNIVRRVERSIESELIDVAEDDIPSTSVHPFQPKRDEIRENEVKVKFKDSQIRMINWLNSLPLKKYVTWFSQVGNSHAVIVVRDPTRFPIHELGRPILRIWAKGIIHPSTSSPVQSNGSYTSS